MKRNAKTIIAGMIALAISHTAMADDIKVAVVGAMSGPIAQWGDMEFNGARQAIKDINAKGGIKGDKLVGVATMPWMAKIGVLLAGAVFSSSLCVHCWRNLCCGCG